MAKCALSFVNKLTYSLDGAPGAGLIAKDDFSSPTLVARAVVAEVLGTGALVLIGCGSCLAWGSPAATPLQVAITFGFIIASMVQVSNNLYISEIFTAPQSHSLSLTLIIIVIIITTIII